ncbi:hypothetical protein [Paenibacillus aquistagni]|uniref:hypothetical protein n=1 Tax=Paenibacillus aquistagni TaxID=1852522 RepID=UPI00145B3C28|nr:hypothetical protein [Paenibacillus aquistagni]NMM52050.1 hypothetical protein [Paenibacillus aquistagni]
MATVWDIDEWVDNAASLPIKSFYPTAVARATNLPLNVVFDRLLYLAEGKKINLLYEIRCPEYECTRVVKCIDKFTDIEFSQTCSIHGKFEISSDTVFPIFQFDQEFKERAKIKKKQVQGRIYLNPTLVY